MVSAFAAWILFKPQLFNVTLLASAKEMIYVFVAVIVPIVISDSTFVLYPEITPDSPNWMSFDELFSVAKTLGGINPMIRTTVKRIPTQLFSFANICCHHTNKDMGEWPFSAILPGP